MDHTSSGPSDAEASKRLMLLMVQHQRQIFSFIYSLAPDRHDAEDLLQETSLVICEKFAEFKPGTNFLAWACQIALWRVRAARQKFARSKIIFDDEVLGTCGNHGDQICKENSTYVTARSNAACKNFHAVNGNS